jgi:16S rRNA processing protein RimM
MLLLGHLAKVQGLKGEFLLHPLMDEPERLAQLQGLILAPPNANPSGHLAAKPVRVRSFRWQQNRPCIAFEDMPDRTAAEPFKGWSLWMPEEEAALEEGESFRHQWEGCDVFIGPKKVGEVLRLEPTPGGYDMVIMKDLRPGRFGQREIPYIKAWFTLDLPHKRIELDPPEGLLELDQM